MSHSWTATCCGTPDRWKLADTPDGTAITVRVTSDDETTTLEVADDGPGIPTTDLPHLTDRFYRAGDPLQRASRGVGLGLAFCSQVLVLHGSHLEVDSAEGAGATFRLTLSRAPIAVPSPTATSELLGQTAATPAEP